MAYEHHDKIERFVPSAIKATICDLVLAWAKLDTVVSYWMGLMFALDMDVASILTGNMDVKTRLERMKVLSTHFGNHALAKKVADIAKQERTFSEPRNMIAHRNLLGLRREEAIIWLVFQSTKHIKGEPGQYEMVEVDLRKVVDATEFALRTADQIVMACDALEGTRAKTRKQSSAGLIQENF